LISRYNNRRKRWSFSMV